ncbi:multiple sugar transport system permease protein [Aequitasia blattaphilus]|uniref:Carbohydrate ABC transporter permease n=1 Tax=Aequitasia blattaphilus TaxID=2949332 RepID=A0ABT1E7M2_9FIRM|nr:carbohydrate ABC transporter permease [Aequitasia blattaphilus]MCP1100851.1 carbohydrate ABC transporter permease [Aequitasia blattaphilus]MCR8613491.1 carbohydrate ABC transporter permease [Aequitasia blattaphilus]
MKDSKKRTKILIYLIMCIGAVVMIVPFIWMILTAFKTPTEATSLNPFVFFPRKWKLDAFIDAWSKMDFIKLYLNTILMIVGRVICAVVTATMAGYAFGRLNFKGKNFAFSLVLFQMMVPPQIFIIPQYLIVNKLGLLNTTFSLVFPGLVSAFGTFLLRQSFKSLPKDLEEAARLDGCNIGQTFLHIMMPLAKSNMVALGIFTAIFAYKDLMWPLVANTEQSSMPLSSALAKLQGQFQANYPQLMAAALISCILIVVIYLIFQRQFIEGIATSGGKL